MEPTVPNQPNVTHDLTHDRTQDRTQDPSPDLTDLTQREVRTPARPKGPNASAIVFGLVAVLLAGLIIAKETMDLRVDWSRVGPGGIIGLGVVMAAIGAIGLVRRHDDS